jgi:glycosyltransferase involved in cell wall biosynthesis
LQQTYTNIEIFIIDDGSQDDSLAEIGDIMDTRINIIRKENGGRATALNVGLAQIKGEYFTTQDADDTCVPNRIEKLVQFMENNQDIGAVFSGYDMIIDDQHMAPRFAFKSREECKRDIDNMRMPAHDPTGMFRVSKVSGFRYEESLRVAAGYDYILRVGERHPMMVLGECLYSYRYNLSSVTHCNVQLREVMVEKVLERACQRRGIVISQNTKKNVMNPASTRHRDVDNGLTSHFMESVIDQKRAKQFLGALKTSIQCLSLHFLDPYYYKPLLYALLPSKLIYFYRTWKTKLK